MEYNDVMSIALAVLTSIIIAEQFPRVIKNYLLLGEKYGIVGAM